MYTPGTWKVEHSRGNRPVTMVMTVDRKGLVICDMNKIGGNDIEADARLIAAAPELLEACKAAETELKQLFKIAAMYGTDAPFYPVLDQVRAAIAKAETTSKGR